MDLTNKFVSFQPGMPISIDEIKARSNGLDFKALIEHTVKNTNICSINNNNGQVLQTVPVLGHDIPFMDANLIRAKGWTIVITPPNGHKFSALTQSYWNCICKKNNIHHKIVGRCPVCKKNATVKQMDYIEDILGDLLQWELIVGDNKMEYTEKKVSKMFKDYGKLVVTFTKANGDKRVMVCTKDFGLIPKEQHPKPLEEGQEPRKKVEGLCNVYEIGVGWRSFYYVKIIDIESA